MAITYFLGQIGKMNHFATCISYADGTIKEIVLSERPIDFKKK